MAENNLHHFTRISNFSPLQVLIYVSLVVECESAADFFKLSIR